MKFARLHQWKIIAIQVTAAELQILIIVRDENISNTTSELIGEQLVLKFSGNEPRCWGSLVTGASWKLL